MKRPDGSLASDKNAGSKTLFKLDWTLGFYEKDKDQYANLREILLPNVAKVDFDRDRFLNLLSFSFSLSLKEKKRVLSSFSDTGLSEFQIRELMNTFEDERKEFDKLLDSESRQICQLYFRSLDSWARLLWGNFQGCQKLNLILNDLVSDDSKISNQLPRDAHFWKIAADYAVSWKAQFGLLEKIIDKGQSSIEDNDQFSLEVIDFLYKTDLDQLEDRLSYVRQRVGAAQICLDKVLDKDASAVVIARAWAMGVCKDWLLLNEEDKAVQAIEKAETAINEVKGNKKKDGKKSDYPKKIKDAEVAVFSWKINTQATFNHSDDEMIKTLKSLQKIQSPENLNDYAIDSLYYKLQFPLASNYLYKTFSSLTSEEIPNERLHAFETAHAAIELLVIGTIVGNFDCRFHATMFLLGFCQKYIFEAQPGPHEISKWRDIHRAFHIVNWIGYVGKKNLRSSIDEVGLALESAIKNKGIKIFPSLENKSELEDLSKLRKLSPIQIATFCMRGLILENKNISDIWRYAIADRRILFQTIVVVFAFSENTEIRSKAQSLAHALLGGVDGGLFGPDLKHCFSMFRKFGSKLSFCGSKNPFDNDPYYWKSSLIE